MLVVGSLLKNTKEIVETVIGIFEEELGDGVADKLGLDANTVDDLAQEEDVTCGGKENGEGGFRGETS